MNKSSLYFFLVILLFLPFSTLSAEGTLDSSQPMDYAKIGNIVFAGMIIVFASLLVILIVVTLLQFVERKERSKPKESKKKKRSNSKNPLKISLIKPMKKQKKKEAIDHHIQLAVITTIFLYETEIEKRSQMLLTMKRAKVSAWQESARLLCPIMPTQKDAIQIIKIRNKIMKTYKMEINGKKFEGK